jgi:transcriptional regulator with XRE-family HTH domain
LRPAQFAQKIGVSRSAALQWENRRSEPSLAMIEKIAETLGVSPEYLAFGIDGGESLNDSENRLVRQNGQEA